MQLKEVYTEPETLKSVGFFLIVPQFKDAILQNTNIFQNYRGLWDKIIYIYIYIEEKYDLMRLEKYLLILLRIFLKKTVSLR